MLNLRRRTLVRIASFSFAVMAVLLASNIMYMSALKKASNAIESAHMLAVEELSGSSDKIYSALEKSRFAASPEMLGKLSSEVASQAANAKSALLDLPLSNTELSNTEKFLSQVGNYSKYLAQLSSEGNLSYKDYITLEKLSQAAKDFRDKLYALESALMSGDESLTQLFEVLEDGSFVTEGISGLEDTFAEIPKLIYDGPYSDHILEKTPNMTKDANPVAYEEALRKAAKAAGVEEWTLREMPSEEGKMPSYRFAGDNVTASVTKSGGYLSYLLKSRRVENTSLTVEDALDCAENYLDYLGIDDMETTYYECYNNVLTVNFAYEDGNVICYTDLIKVTVALDNGDILGFDGRGYLVNHRDREFGEPKLSKSEAMEKLSPMLNVTDSQLALIPTDNVEETLCYEFKCKTRDGQTVLVYVNCSTGTEEDILLLTLSENSVLAS